MITSSRPIEHEKATPGQVPESIYVHIPFCTHKCEFCDFAAFAGLSDREDEYTQILCYEIENRLKAASRPNIKTLFFGGGTPGLMAERNLERIFQALQRVIRLDEDAEISLETTPHAITAGKAAFWKELGINRVSIGIESLSDSELTAIGRDHSVTQAMAGIELAVSAGLPDISLDFMYGLPTQTLETFGQTLATAIELSKRWPVIAHFSAYCLELSTNSALKSRFPDGHAAYPHEDAQVAMYHLLVKTMADAGFAQYEVSNFSRPGRESRHNMTYWLNKPYYAFGVGAHRYVDGVRSSNTRSFAKYLRHPLADDTSETIDDNTRGREAVMLGLRMIRGLDLAELKAQYGIDLLAEKQSQLEMMQAEGLVQLSDGKLSLTQSGIPISNSIIATLI